MDKFDSILAFCWVIVGYIISILVSMITLTAFQNAWDSTTPEVNAVVIVGFLTLGVMIGIASLIYFLSQFKVVRR